MDPLSMTASIIAILQLTTTLTGYINDVRHATSEQAKVAVEASNLYGLMTSLRFRVEGARSDDPWFNQVKILGTPNGPLDQFKDTLETMVEQISSSRKRDQIKSALMWKFTRSEIEDALRRIERLKSLISCALTNDLFTLSQVIHGEVVALEERTKQLDIRTERLQTHADHELQHKLSRWLGLPDPSTNYHAALEKRHPDTGLWLLNGQRFDDWKTSTSSLMWLHGNAGCGKTVLSAALLQNIIKDKESQPDTIVGYFYFDFNDIEKQSSRKAVRSLLFQFTLQKRDRLQVLEKLYQRCENGQQQPAEDVIRSLLRDEISCTENKYIILDALDECTDREAFLTFLRELIESNHQGLRAIATSRRERDIEDQLSAIANHNINIQSAVVDEDIRVYVRDRLAKDTKLKKWPPAVQDEIITVLMEKAGGMFRWVYCQIESIRQCIKLSALRKALSTLPKTLNETYDRILQGLESAGQLQDAITVLRWLCYSKRPLKLSEMVDILAIEIGDNGGFFPDERLPDPADIMVVCSSLISCNAVHDDGDDSIDINSSDNDSSDDGIEADRTTQIRLAHFSVKEYLSSDRCALRSDFQTQTCHMVMTEGCLRYLLHLCEKAPLTDELVDQHPLAMYAAEYWWQHARIIDSTLDPTVFELASRLLRNENAALLSWVQLYNIDKGWEGLDLSRTRYNVSQPLYYAALIGVSEVVRNILQQNLDVNAQGGRYGNALQAASRSGHEKVVQMLLDAGADVNSQGELYGNALYAASMDGYEKVVQMLLDAGADVNAQGGEYGNALQAASMDGHEKVVQMLLDAGADVNAQEGLFGNALQIASFRGHETVVQMLLDAGADVNSQRGTVGNALQEASKGGHEKVVQMLLDAGADVNAQGGEYGNALQVALKGGYEKVVQMLLDAGADVNAQEGLFGNALQLASFRGHETAVQMLLDAGADVNSQRGRVGNALQEASKGGHETVVQMLLDAGADVNAQGGLYGNALQAASMGGHEKVVQMLLDAGADVNAQGGKYGNALQAASIGGHETAVQMLLDAGADVNSQGELYGNALQAASMGGHETAVQMLLDAGADVNSQGGKYGNALQAASRGGHEKVVQMLLDAGADVNSQGGLFGNVLQAASEGGHEKVVQMLLDAGADVNAQGGLYGNALYAASMGGHEKVVQMLLDAGADVNAQGGLYGNALQAASIGGHEKVVQMLLDAGADVNAQGGDYGNVLQAASRDGHEKVVQMLLDAGADVNAQGGLYGNALYAASRGGHEKVVQMLLDAGADVNAQGGLYGNALYAASMGGHKKVGRMLLDAAAGVSESSDVSISK